MESLINLRAAIGNALIIFISVNLFISLRKSYLLSKYPVTDKMIFYIDIIYILLNTLFFMLSVLNIYLYHTVISENPLEAFAFYIILYLILSLFSTDFFQNLAIIWKNLREFIRTLFLIEFEDKNDIRTLNSSERDITKEINYNLEVSKVNEDFSKLLKQQGIYHSTSNNEMSDFYKLDENVPSKFFFVLKHFEDLNVRNELEIKRLISFSRQNLLLGTLISIAAIVFLIYDYKASEAIRKLLLNNVNLFNYFEYYFPKFSIIVLIEVIAFFFLRLYRNSIIDIKNRQDKKNEIDMQIILLKLSILSNNDDNLKEITNTLLDSNKVIKDDKKESNNDVDNQKQYTEIIKELISKIKI